MKKFFVSMVFALSALVMLTGCVVSEEKLTDKVTQGIVEYALILAFVVVIAVAITNAGGLKDKVSEVFSRKDTQCHIDHDPADTDHLHRGFRQRPEHIFFVIDPGIGGIGIPVSVQEIIFLSSGLDLLDPAETL